MKKITSLILIVLVILTYSVFALGSTAEKDDEGINASEQASALGDYVVEIDSCRLATSKWDNENVVIVKYKFTNNNEDAAAFQSTVITEVYQDSIGLNKYYGSINEDNYNTDNQSKKIKQGGTIEVEVAYELNDTTTDIEVEVSEFFSFSNKKITKVLPLQ